MDDRNGRGSGQTARRYHDGTKHSPQSIRSVPHFLDWNNQPLPFKLYRGLETLALPDVTGPARAKADSTGFERLSRILFYTAGVTKKRRFADAEMLFRAAACTGALYHIEIYVVCESLRGLDAGVYHYGPKDGVLSRLRVGDWRAVLVAASGDDPSLRDAPIALVLTTTYWRNAWKYRTRAYRHAFWDSGTMLANLTAMAQAAEAPAHLVLGFADAHVNALLDVDSEKEAAVAIVALGTGATEVPAKPGPVEALGIETVPLSRSEMDYPQIRETHRASSLSGGSEVKTWRERSDAPSREASDVALPEPVEKVILRRGSSRTFRRAPIPAEALSAILAAGAQDIDADVPVSWTDMYVIVHSVEGLSPGSYIYQRERAVLELLKEGEFRSEARFLDLEQDLAGDASVNVYTLTALPAVLSRLGDRGYRVAQLEGGIRGGRMYLASYALGLGATGLTFFDDAVTEFFSPHAAGKDVMFLLAAGVPARKTVLYQS